VAKRLAEQETQLAEETNSETDEQEQDAPAFSMQM